MGQIDQRLEEIRKRWLQNNPGGTHYEGCPDCDIDYMDKLLKAEGKRREAAEAVIIEWARWKLPEFRQMIENQDLYRAWRQVTAEQEDLDGG